MTINSQLKSLIKRANFTRSMILPNGTLVSLDTRKTRRNNNIVCIGGSGTGKTCSLVEPNLAAAVDSYILSDPKGSLRKKYGSYLKQNGYEVIHIDFIHPEQSDGYNPLDYVRNNDDIQKLSHHITFSGAYAKPHLSDPFWTQSSELMLNMAIAYLMETGGTEELPRNLSGISRIIQKIDADAIERGKKCELDNLFNTLAHQDITISDSSGVVLQPKKSWAYEQYQKFRMTPERTMNCIIVTLQSILAPLDTDGIRQMMNRETLDFTSAGRQKTAVFLTVSDTDRSKDSLINLFYAQALNELCTYADEKCSEFCLPVPVRFILDDFGTNCRIDNFENIISNIRSRNISAMLMLQSKSQLVASYQESSHTILDNCDTMLYMGGNDIDTAEMIGKRSNSPLYQIMEMPVGMHWLFRRGEKSQYSKTMEIYQPEKVLALEFQLTP